MNPSPYVPTPPGPPPPPKPPVPPYAPFIGVKLMLQNGRKLNLYVGSFLTDLRYRGRHGRVHTVTGYIKGITAQPMPRDEYDKRVEEDKKCDHPAKPIAIEEFFTLDAITVDCSKQYQTDVRIIPIGDIISIGAVRDPGYGPNDVVIGPGPLYKTLQDVLAEVPEGTVVRLLNGTYEGDVSITRPVTITSAPNSQATLTGKITVNTAGAPFKGGVMLKNLTLTGNATISVVHADAFAMDNVSFHGHDIVGKTMPVSITEEGPMLLSITDCDFGAQNDSSYNLIDCYAKLTKGSTISRNNFEEDCCTHNQISLYGIDDGATIDINENYAYMSANMIRIGFKGRPDGEVRMFGNRYDFTSKKPQFEGLFFVQPYGTQTLSFADVTLSFDEPSRPCGTDIGYLYSGSTDMPWTPDNKPQCFCNGEIYKIKDSSPVAVELEGEQAAQL